MTRDRRRTPTPQMSPFVTTDTPQIPRTYLVPAQGWQLRLSPAQRTTLPIPSQNTEGPQGAEATHSLPHTEEEPQPRDDTVRVPAPPAGLEGQTPKAPGETPSPGPRAPWRLAKVSGADWRTAGRLVCIPPPRPCWGLAPPAIQPPSWVPGNSSLFRPRVPVCPGGPQSLLPVLSTVFPEGGRKGMHFQTLTP